MKPQQIKTKERRRFRRLYAALFFDCFDYNEEHLAFLRIRRDNYLQSLKAQ